VTKRERLRRKACDVCGERKETLYRIQTELAGDWYFACPTCRDQRADDPNYRYGGTWKARKRH